MNPKTLTHHLFLFSFSAWRYQQFYVLLSAGNWWTAIEIEEFFFSSSNQYILNNVNSKFLFDSWMSRCQLRMINDSKIERFESESIKISVLFLSLVLIIYFIYINFYLCAADISTSAFSKVPYPFRYLYPSSKAWQLRFQLSGVALALTFCMWLAVFSGPIYSLFWSPVGINKIILCGFSSSSLSAYLLLILWFFCLSTYE